MNETNSQNDDSNLERLIESAKQGDEDAREHLFFELQGYVTVIASQQFNNQLQQKLGRSDIVQMTMLNAAKNFDDFRGSSPGELKAWLKKILVHEVRSSERAYFSSKRNVKREARNAETESQPGPSALLIDSLPTPGTQAVGDERTRLVIEALHQLPDEYRQVIELRTWQNLPFKEISKLMNRSENATIKLWLRALVQLQSKLDEN